jgi:hypothetical protein
MVSATLPRVRSLAASVTIDSAVITRRLYTLIVESLCAFRGHDFDLHFESRRVFLRCAACGHETPGWRLDAIRYRFCFPRTPANQNRPTTPTVLAFSSRSAGGPPPVGNE